jgi:ABC-2 type transport system permease protein
MTTTVTGAGAPAIRAGASAPRHSTTLTGTWRLVRFTARLDRVRITLWVVGIALMVLLSAWGINDLYPTQAELSAAAAPLYDNAAFIALQGPTYAIDTLGGQIVFQLGGFGYVVIALMGMFLVGAHTRGDEEQGRTELVRATIVGRNAPVTAALIVTTAAMVVLGALITLSMLTVDLPVAGSVAYGAAMAAFGIFFAAVMAVAAQVTEHNRTAYGIAGAALGASYVVRAVGDVGSGSLSWLSPMGWAQGTKPYAGERWWPLLLLVGGAALLTAQAYSLLWKRDLGSGLVAPRPGPSTASRLLTNEWGLVARMQRATLIGWVAGLALTGVAYGAIGEDVEDLIGDSEEMADIMTQAQGDITDSYFASALLMMAVIAAGYAVSSALRMRSDETGNLAEPVLATGVSRWTWLASHLVMALVGSALVIAAAGLTMGLTFAFVSGDAGEIGRLTGASLGFIPAMWVLVGVVTALFGLVPRAGVAAWALLAWCGVVAFLGKLLDLPQWTMDLSPFQHVPAMPLAEVDWLPLGLLTLVAAVLIVAGAFGFHHRDAGY